MEILGGYGKLSSYKYSVSEIISAYTTMAYTAG